MKIVVICSNQSHPVYTYLLHWQEENKHLYQIELITSANLIENGGDILFLVSCTEIVEKSTRDLFDYSLVLHASDLPKGRGWSPHVWEIINGAPSITLSLLSAENGVDTGDIWKKKVIHLDGGELFNEINHKLFEAELELMSWACKNISSASPQPQKDDALVDYYRRRGPEDSELDVDASIRSQFNLMRVCDPDRFPAFFLINGKKYYIRLEKADD